MGIIEITLVVGLIVLANVVKKQNSDTFIKLFDLLLIWLNAPLFLLGVLFVFQTNELRSMVNLQLDSPVAFGIFLQATAVWGVIVSFRSTRHSLERWMPINPHSPLHTLALVLSGYFAGSVILQVIGGLENFTENLPRVSIALFLVQQAGFVLIAFLGVGAVMRRDWTAVFQRLDLGPVNGRQLVEALGWIALLVVLQALGGAAWELIDPAEVAQVEALSERLYEGFGFWHWLGLAVGAGIGEEILFRGALQPVLGIWFTSLLFAVVHVQYGLLNPATMVLFLLAVILGTIKQRHNTTVAIFVHFGYNLVLALITLMATTAAS
ncbi:MAG: CPBP family intramembrane metalloprotease [Anaerolineaceae bacterium]|nr:CPBP family intramembrane metalloprotease [Anaerolineaceae bacterium]